MEGEEGKQISHKNPYIQLSEEEEADFLQAIGLQEQEQTELTMLETIESEIEEESTSDSSFANDDSDTDFILSQEDLQFLEGEGSNYDEDMDIEEDEIDLDELSYEELLELGEFIGKEKTGLSANEISKCLSPCKSDQSKSGIDRCVICQVEYEEGEVLVALHCDHPYHSDCITKWLQIKKVCPICTDEVSITKKNP